MPKIEFHYLSKIQLELKKIENEIEMKINNETNRFHGIFQSLSSCVCWVARRNPTNLNDQDDDDVEIADQLFRAIVAGELPQLKTLWNFTFTYPDSSSIDLELISEAVIRLEDCHLGPLTLSADQHRAILNKIIDTKDLKLKRYHIDIEREIWNMRVPAMDIMKAAVKLEHTNIHGLLSNNSSQKVFFFEFLAESPIMNVKRLDTGLTWRRRRGVEEDTTRVLPPNVLVAAVARVEDVKAKDLTQDQSIALFTKIASREGIKLKKLVIEWSWGWVGIVFGCGMSNISPDILAEAVV